MRGKLVNRIQTWHENKNVFMPVNLNCYNQL